MCFCLVFVLGTCHPTGPPSNHIFRIVHTQSKIWFFRSRTGNAHNQFIINPRQPTICRSLSDAWEIGNLSLLLCEVFLLSNWQRTIEIRAPRNQKASEWTATWGVKLVLRPSVDWNVETKISQQFLRGREMRENKLKAKISRLNWKFAEISPKLRQQGHFSQEFT